MDIEQIKREHEEAKNYLQDVNTGIRGQLVVSMRRYAESVGRESALLAHIERLEKENEQLKTSLYNLSESLKLCRGRMERYARNGDS